jgi:ATP phosphoribosyltransferase
MYPRLVNRYFMAHGVNYYALVSAAGTLESAPASGYADLIVDITATGTTLRANHLKILNDGVILESQACLVGNRRRLTADEGSLKQARAILERIEAHIRAGAFYRLTANIKGSSAEGVAEGILKRRELSGLQGPTVSTVYSTEGGWYSVSVVVPGSRLLEGVEHLRQVGAINIFTSQVNYLFGGQCEAYETLLRSRDEV